MKFRLLGPLEVVRDGAPLSIRATRQRAVLASLLVDANRVVPFDVLVARVWEGDPPSRTALHNLVMRLRHALGPEVIRTHADGYSVEASADDLDLLRFDRAVDLAKGAHDPRRVSALLTEALALWRGEPLADVPSEALRREVAPGLVEQRLVALERRIDADLALGAHHDLVAELRELTVRHPLRERFWGQRMLALHRSGRQAEALECYRRVARLLADELGVDPGRELRELHRSMLTDQVPQASRVAPVPRQLPVRTPHFVGRERELSALGEAGRTYVITAIDGTAGIGKTTLAVHWAHLSADRFPDGQLYVNLRGFDPVREPTHPAEAIRGFLDAFAVPSERIPAGLDAQAALYRSLVADRRVLVVLDNARDVEQVRPLLPASPSCLVLVTSRNPLTGLVAREGAHPLPLGLLTGPEATALLVRHLGPQRVAAQPAAVAELVAHCAHLPLALSLMAARAAVNPGLELRTLADELRDEQHRLDALDADDPANGVRAVFSYSYRWLSPPAARLFRLLGTHPGPTTSAVAAAGVAGLPVARTRELLGELTATGLLDQPAPDRFALHDLLRAYAAEQPDDERRAATHRLLDHYLHTSLSACALLDPRRPMIEPDPAVPGAAPVAFTDRADALAWYREEHQVLLAVLPVAEAGGFDRHAWQLPWSLATYLNFQGHVRDWLGTQLVALHATERLGDVTAQARTHLVIGNAYGHLPDHERSVAHFSSSLELFRELGDGNGQAHALTGIGWAYGQAGRDDEALPHTHRAYDQYVRMGNRDGQARALNALGYSHARIGNHREAIRYCARALEVLVELGDLRMQTSVRHSLGYAHQRLGEHREAVEHFTAALALGESSGYRTVERVIRDDLGDSLAALGDRPAAEVMWLAAYRIAAREPGDAANAILAKLGMTTPPQ